MSREKLPRPASMTEAIDNLTKAKATFDRLTNEAVKEATSGDIKRAEVLIKEGHVALLTLKDSYNRAYGQIQGAARAQQKQDEPKAEKKSAPKAEKPVKADDDQEAV